MAASQEHERFEVGHPVVHPGQGAGVIAGIVELSLDGEAQHYYRIELVNGAGMLLVPVEQAEQIGLRDAIAGAAAIRIVLQKEPRDLHDDHKARQAGIQNQIRSGDPREVARALRDLAYRERSDGLTSRDERLRDEAAEMLTGELAVAEGLTLDVAQARLREILSTSIDDESVVETPS